MIGHTLGSVDLSSHRSFFSSSLARSCCYNKDPCLMVAVWQGDNGIVRPLCKDGRSISISQVPHLLPSSSPKQGFLIDIHVEAAALRKSTSSSSSTTTMQKATSEWPMEQDLLGRVISTTCVLCFARILCDSTAMFVEQWRCAYADAPPDTPTHRGQPISFFQVFTERGVSWGAVVGVTFFSAERSFFVTP